MAPKSRLSTTSTRKWAKCFSGSQSRKEGGKSRSCFKLSERKHLAMAASYSQTILWKATFLILLANFCESISDRLLDCENFPVEATAGLNHERTLDQVQPGGPLACGLW